MPEHTLKDNQGKDLSVTLESLLPRISREEPRKVGESLLKKLKGLEPKRGQVWASIYLSEAEETLFKILATIQWEGSPSKSTPEEATNGKQE